MTGVAFARIKPIGTEDDASTQSIPQSVMDQLVVPQAAKNKTQAILEADERNHNADSFPEEVEDMGSDEEEGYFGGPNPTEETEAAPSDSPEEKYEDEEPIELEHGGSNGSTKTDTAAPQKTNPSKKVNVEGGRP